LTLNNTENNRNKAKNQTSLLGLALPIYHILGIFFLRLPCPNWLIDEDLRAGTLINAFPDYDVTATDFSTAAWLVYPTRAYVPLKVRVFLDSKPL